MRKHDEIMIGLDTLSRKIGILEKLASDKAVKLEQALRLAEKQRDTFKHQRDTIMDERDARRAENEELRRELHALDGRLRHLLQSKTIQLFDEVEHPLRQQYRLDIKILDDCCTLRHCVTCKYKGVDDLFPPCSNCAAFGNWESKE